MELKFSLKSHKCKCTHCDIISLVEQDNWSEPLFSCPACEREMEHMEDITVVQETVEKGSFEKLNMSGEKWIKIIEHDFKAGELLVNVKFEIATPLGILTGSDVIHYKHLKYYEDMALQELKEFFKQI